MADKREVQEINRLLLAPKVRRLRNRVRNLLADVRIVHGEAQDSFNQGEFHGGKMRNLDDAECWLSDVSEAMAEFLTKGD